MTCEHETDVVVGERPALFSKVGCRKCGAYLGTVVPTTSGDDLVFTPSDRVEWDRSRGIAGKARVTATNVAGPLQIDPNPARAIERYMQAACLAITAEMKAAIDVAAAHCDERVSNED